MFRITHFLSALITFSIVAYADEMETSLYPEITNCFLGVQRKFEEKALERLARVNDKCGTSHQNRTSLCFKMCVLSALHLVGKDYPALNEDIMKNPDKYNELSYQGLMAVEYRAVSGPVWALVALRILGIAYADIRDEYFDREKYLMKVRMEQCKSLRFQTPIAEQKGCAKRSSRETAQPEEWNKLIECIENSLKC